MFNVVCDCWACAAGDDSMDAVARRAANSKKRRTPWFAGSRVDRSHMFQLLVFALLVPSGSAEDDGHAQLWVTQPSTERIAASFGVPTRQLALKTDDSGQETDRSAKDDTALLDSLARKGGLIQLEPRVYHRTGSWIIATNNTVVKGYGAGLTQLFVHTPKNATVRTCATTLDLPLRPVQRVCLCIGSLSRASSY